MYLHAVRVVRGELLSGQELTATVDPARLETRKHHSATHLLHAALREVLGEHVNQAGSLVTADRLRFDFSQPAALPREQISPVERKVNAWIQAELVVRAETVRLESARAQGAMMLSGE